MDVCEARGKIISGLVKRTRPIASHHFQLHVQKILAVRFRLPDAIAVKKS